SKENAKELNQSYESSTKRMHIQVDNYPDDQITNEENTNISNDNKSIEEIQPPPKNHFSQFDQCSKLRNFSK
ncbi:1451_t:CDS:2, partial [Dentiscutata erythropus]